MKKIKVFLSIFFFCIFGFVSCTAATGDAAGTVPGDVNGDGRVTAADARLVLRAAVGLDASDPARMDMNADGKVSAADARLVLRLSVGLEIGPKKEEPEEETALRLKINDTLIDVVWEDNASVSALAALAKEKTVTVQLSPYGGFEQVGALGTNLPRNDEPITTGPGDIVLYNGNRIVVFYGTNSWSYTPLGRIRGLDEQALAALLGNSAVTLTLFCAS